MNDFAPFIPWLGVLLAFGCLLLALRSGRRQRLVDYLPTSKTTGVFIGLVELKGTAESEAPLTSYLAEQHCVHYAYSIEEHWSRTVIETYTDSNGKTQTRTRQESGWSTVGSGGEMTAFYVKDDCGAIRVVPDGATLEPATIFDQTCGRADPLYYAKGPAMSVANSDHRRRFVEQAIALHADLYVMGQSRERADIVAPEIAQDKQAPLFLISTRTEDQIRRGFGASFWGLWLLGLVLSVFGFLVRDHVRGLDLSQRVILYVMIGVGYLAASGLGWLWMVYNSLIDLRQRVRQGWAQVDVQLKRRHDLIPNLVNVVKGLRDYEQNLQTELAALRAEATATPPGEPGPDHHACTSLLVAVAEKYPQLTAQKSFLDLQQNLSDTEQRIALARGYFNEIATHYNTRREIIPDRFVAALAGLQPQALMQANDFERAPIEVKFAD